MHDADEDVDARLSAKGRPRWPTCARWGINVVGKGVLVVETE
jgi:hypothetical protein